MESQEEKCSEKHQEVFHRDRSMANKNKAAPETRDRLGENYRMYITSTASSF
jgi:hypothetical protein